MSAHEAITPEQRRAEVLAAVVAITGRGMMADVSTISDQLRWARDPQHTSETLRADLETLESSGLVTDSRVGDSPAEWHANPLLRWQILVAGALEALRPTEPLPVPELPRLGVGDIPARTTVVVSEGPTVVAELEERETLLMPAPTDISGAIGEVVHAMVAMATMRTAHELNVHRLVIGAALERFAEAIRSDALQGITRETPSETVKNQTDGGAIRSQ